MQKFTSVHPVITKIKADINGSYKVYETLKIARIPFSFTYTVVVEPMPQHNKVTMYATVMRFTKIAMTFTLKEEQGFTVVEEEINFRSPLPIVAILKRIFRKQHKQLFKNIDMAG